MSRRRSLLLAGAVVTVAVVTVGGWVFQPWKLVVDDSVDEAPPAVAAPAPGPSTPAAPDPMAPGSSAVPVPPPDVGPTAPTVLAGGRFVSHEHTTSGTVEVLGLVDGSRVLRISDLDTSNGPVLRVWLTDAPVLPGRQGWGVFDDGRYVDLGPLKGNIGSQNYEVPDDVDLEVLTSVSIWCDRFDVSFGAASLGAGGG